MRPEIPGYTIIAEIHRSPGAVVYRARQDALDRDVLIKVLQTNWSRDPELAARFLREARACARLQHPNIIQIYDFGQADGVPYLVLEFVESGDLERLLQERGRLPIPEAEHIFCQLLEALDYAHRHGIWHRDIKPANVLISPEGQVKLTDFGLSVFLESRDISAGDSLVGTPAYLAPEQVQGKAAGPAADLFAAGIILYEMLTGFHPFRGQNTSETLYRLLNFNPRPVKELRPDCPEHLAQVCMRLLEKDPARRFATAREALDALSGTQCPVQAQAGRRPSAVRWIGGAVLLLIAGLAAGFLLHSRSKREASLPPPATARKDTALAKQTAETPDSAQTESPERPAPEKKERPVHETKITEKPHTAPPPRANFAQKNGAAAEPSAAPDPALIALECQPWAQVFLDGKPAGTTPLERPLEVPAGQHVLELRNPYCSAHTDTLVLKPGEKREVRVVLPPLFGTLFLDVKPWAAVFVDGAAVDTTPLVEPLRLRAGKHRLQLVNPGFPKWESDIIVLPDQKDTLRVVLTKK